MEVPEDATRVTFTLESDADVALLVRYGEDIALEDGRPVLTTPPTRSLRERRRLSLLPNPTRRFKPEPTS